MPDAAPLTLPETGLRFDGATLIRTDDSGNQTLAFPAEKIISIRFHQSLNWMGILMITVGIMIAYTGYEAAEANLLKVVLYILGVLICAFGFLTIQQDKITIIAEQQSLSLDASDSTDIAEGFVFSINERLSKISATRT